MMRVLVTGGAGFIGSALVKHLVLNRTAEVLNVDKLTYAGNLKSLQAVEGQGNYRFINADICDGAAMMEAISSFRPTWIMHLAAESHVDRSITGPATFVATNVVGTYTILECARRYWMDLKPRERNAFRLLHVSTDEVFGSLGNSGYFTELSSYDPSSPYSASKASSDHMARAWARTYGLPVIVSNCSNNYGPYQHPEKLIPVTITNAVNGLVLPVYGNGENIRDWLHVEDHVRALDQICTRGRVGETYNVGARNERRNIEVVRQICQLLEELKPHSRPYHQLIKTVADRAGHDYRYAIDPTKLEQEIGWRPTETFDSGLRQTITWYLENHWWWAPQNDPAPTGGEKQNSCSVEFQR